MGPEGAEIFTPVVINRDDTWGNYMSDLDKPSIIIVSILDFLFFKCLFFYGQCVSSNVVTVNQYIWSIIEIFLVLEFIVEAAVTRCVHLNISLVFIIFYIHPHIS